MCESGGRHISSLAAAPEKVGFALPSQCMFILHRDSNQATMFIMTKRATEKAEIRKGTETGSTPSL